MMPADDRHLWRR